jgi:enediyne biosynthesis protein E4
MLGDSRSRLRLKSCDGRHIKRAAWCALALALPVALLSQNGGPIRFENRQRKSSIDFVLNNGTTPDKPIVDSVLGGVAVLDFDRDGYLDVFFTNGAHIPSLEKRDASFYNRLYHNNHDGTFTDVTAHAGVAGAGYSMGVAVGDYDNDGYPDLFVAGVNRNFLYHNNGDGTFSDVTQAAGVAGLDENGKKLWSVGAAWLDYDNDGRLDLFVSNYLDWSPQHSEVCGEPGRRLSCSPVLYKGVHNFLYHNNGDGTFTDVSQATGIAQHVGRGMGLAVGDFDGDGFMDIFVANDNERNFLFHNLGGKHFEEIGVLAGVAYTEDGVPASNMGADLRDVNGDGYPDLITTALAGETFSVRFNAAGKRFTDATYKSRIGLASSVLSGWSVGAYDFDNDGYKDVFFTNSHVSENVHLYSHHQYHQANAVFRNQGGSAFENVTAQAGPDMQTTRAHRGSAFGDLNNDGKMDVVVSAIGQPAAVLYNTSPGHNHWIIIQTEGRQSNRDGIGTRIKLVGESGLVQYNQVSTSVGYVSSSDPRVHFGLGGDARVREIELRWPSGKVQTLKNVAADRIVKVIEK